MATALAIQSILSSSVTCVTSKRNGVNQFFSVKYVPARLQRNAGFTVKSVAEDNNDNKKEQATTPAATPPPPPPQPTRRATKMSTRFSDVLAFSGPAPERINGRLAMIGFVAALAVELSKGQDVFSQISDGGATWFLGTSILLSVASLIPLFKGVSVESKSGDLMTSDAEMWNGRLAMLGLVALAFTEYVKGGTLV